MKPSNAPPNCPRANDDSSGPRRCGLVECPNHLYELSTRGRGVAPRKLRMQRECGDTCAVDVAERAHEANPESEVAMSLREIAILLATDKQQVLRDCRRALLKVRYRRLRFFEGY